MGFFLELYTQKRNHLLFYYSVPTDLANWGPSGPDRTTKILWTGPYGPGPDLREKKWLNVAKKHARLLIYGLFLI